MGQRARSQLITVEQPLDSTTSFRLVTIISLDLQNHLDIFICIQIIRLCRTSPILFSIKQANLPVRVTKFPCKLYLNLNATEFISLLKRV